MKKAIWACCLILLAGWNTYSESVPWDETKPDKTEWFAGKWGVFFHYLGNMPGQKATGKTAEQWNEQIDGFDVEGLAKQLKEVGADYFVITIGQGSGHYLAPNKVYDKLTGITPSKCSNRDLVSELADALNPMGIKVLVYTASDIGWGDLEARKVLKMENHHNDHRLGMKKSNRHQQRKGQIEFLKKSEKIHAQWSTQWGKRVAGWWVDGCYGPEIRFPENEPPNLATLATAIKTGNPQAIITFNTGVRVPVAIATNHEDYTPGEISRELPPCPGPWLEKNGHRSRYHVLTYIGRTWGSGNPRYSDDVIAKFAEDITSKGGFVSIDVPPQRNGLIPDNFITQLKAIDAAVDE